MVSKLTRCILETLFEYDTPKIVHIRSKIVGILNRLIQLLILIYVIAWVLVINKGYQDFSTIDSSVTTKVKGVVLTNFSADELKTDYPEVYNRLWDVAEYVVPPQENGAFFVMTNAIITPNQTQGKCAESNSTIDANCTRDDDCKEGISPINGNGVFTGTCNSETQTCNIYGWCPVEVDVPPLGDRPLLEGSENFTVLIKNSIEFPLWTVKTRNIVHTTLNKTYLNNCRYNAVTDPLCPVFRLGSIIDQIKEENYTKLATKGGVIAIIINWECNLDYDVSYCLPSYTFRRLDDPNADIAQGWNFRYAQHFDNGKTRTLIKAFGILFVILVQGRGGRFSTIPFLMNIGSGLALLSIAVVICDIVVLYFLKKRHYYKDKKFLLVDEVDNSSQEGESEAISSRTHSNVPYKTFPEETDG